MRDSFPENVDFYIGLRDTDLVLDASNSSTEPGSEIILWNKREEDNENQKWIYDDKQIRNKKTGLVLTAPQLSRNVAVDQQHPTGAETQRFEYYDYTISAEANEDLVLGILGAKSEGARVALVPRDNDSDLQQWTIIA
ncbi:ricin B lectin domain-containing protein [Gamsiella multidivaricata]|uniref:ricin B lectin domain-containing protein n=1 Tax=Gamsiella multidivaricata TaxID=101098 RepID=UPI00221E938F|nr:ricin B lectin domain-containing protein [Gamsiella multidivaricata]KAG0349525.1 hypothetical protein BGZ54_004338 [Gamsiella multidivaricata]KAI7816414.1 ricin B lectin domain-containing protein [Gamsiella multidivaricata]